MTQLKVGSVSHYYNKIKVAVVEVTGNIAVGDTIKFVRGGEDLFEQKIESIQVEHEKRDSAHPGEVVGLKTDADVKEGAEIYKLG